MTAKMVVHSPRFLLLLHFILLACLVSFSCADHLQKYRFIRQDSILEDSKDDHVESAETNDEDGEMLRRLKSGRRKRKKQKISLEMSSAPSPYPAPSIPPTQSLAPTLIQVDLGLNYTTYINNWSIGGNRTFYEGALVIDGLPYTMNRKHNNFLPGDQVCVRQTLVHNASFYCYSLRDIDVTGAGEWLQVIPASWFVEKIGPRPYVLAVNQIKPRGRVTVNLYGNKTSIYADSELFPGDEVCVSNISCWNCPPKCYWLKSYDFPDGPPAKKLVLYK